MNFDEWFEELEGFAFRSERFLDDYEHSIDTRDYKTMQKWLRSAFEAGYWQCMEQYNE